MSDFALTEAMINFASGTEVNWNAFQLPIPANMVVYTIDTKKFKRGDGVRKYSELPAGPSVAGIIAGDASVATVLEQLAPGDDDSIIVIDGEKYVASDTKLSTLISRLTALASSDATQSANITTISSQFGMVATGITVADNDKLVVTTNKKLSVGPTQGSLVYQKENPVITIRDINFYSDIDCTNKVTSLDANSVFYADVSCFHETIDRDLLSITLTENSSYITVISLGRGLFRLTTTKPLLTGQVAFTATVSYNTDSVTVAKNIVLNAYYNVVITTYGSAGNDTIQNISFGGAGNLYAVGYTQEGGSSSYTAWAYKFDQNLNILYRKRIGSASSSEVARGLSMEAGGAPYVAGLSYGEGAAGSAFLVKLDGSFNTILAKKFLNGAGLEQFEALVTDPTTNIFGVGISYSDGDATNGSAFIGKFDSNLEMLALKKINGAGIDILSSIFRESTGNMIVVGSTTSEGAGGSDAMIMKFDQDLNLLAAKRIGGTGNDKFSRILVLGSYIYAVGWSDGLGPYKESFVVKFDTNLTVVAKKKYSFSNQVVLDSICTCAGGVAVSGYTTVNGKAYGVIMTLDTNLNMVRSKKIGSVNGDTWLSKGIRVNPVTGDLVAAGETTTVNGSNDVILVKLSPELPAGSYVSLKVGSLEISDITLTAAALDYTEVACTLTAQASALTYNSSTLIGTTSSLLTITTDNIKL
jgi:hypothetical protein